MYCMYLVYILELKNWWPILTYSRKGINPILHICETMYCRIFKIMKNRALRNDLVVVILGTSLIFRKSRGRLGFSGLVGFATLNSWSGLRFTALGNFVLHGGEGSDVTLLQQVLLKRRILLRRKGCDIFRLNSGNRVTRLASCNGHLQISNVNATAPTSSLIQILESVAIRRFRWQVVS